MVVLIFGLVYSLLLYLYVDEGFLFTLCGNWEPLKSKICYILDEIEKFLLKFNALFIGSTRESRIKHEKVVTWQFILIPQFPFHSLLLFITSFFSSSLFIVILWKENSIINCKLCVKRMKKKHFLGFSHFFSLFKAIYFLIFVRSQRKRGKRFRRLKNILFLNHNNI